MVAWKECSNAIPYSVVFYGMAVLAVKNTKDLSGKAGVLFPESFIVPPKMLPSYQSSDVPATSATHYVWVSHELISTYISSLSR